MRAAIAAHAAIALGLLTAAPAAAAPSTTTMTSGVSFSSGDYGEVRNTHVTATPLGITYRTGRWKLRASLPWVHISGPATLLQTPEGGGSNGGPGSGGGDVVDDGDAGRSDSRSGIGDLSLSALYSFDLGHGLYFEPSMKVKLPTASRSKRIGTGKIDLTSSADLVKEYGRTAIYLHARRKFTGQPSGSDLRSVWGAGAGLDYQASKTLFAGLDFDWQQSPIRGRGHVAEMTAWTNVRLAPRWGLTLSATKGFTRESADYAAAAIIAYRL